MRAEQNPIEFKALWAWDTLFQCSSWYKKQNQEFARQTRAPRDCTFRTGQGRWHTLEEIINKQTKQEIQELISWLEENERGLGV